MTISIAASSRVMLRGPGQLTPISRHLRVIKWEYYSEENVEVGVSMWR